MLRPQVEKGMPLKKGEKVVKCCQDVDADPPRLPDPYRIVT